VSEFYAACPQPPPSRKLDGCRELVLRAAQTACGGDTSVHMGDPSTRAALRLSCTVTRASARCAVLWLENVSALPRYSERFNVTESVLPMPGSLRTRRRLNMLVLLWCSLTVAVPS